MRSGTMAMIKTMSKFTANNRIVLIAKLFLVTVLFGVASSTFAATLSLSPSTGVYTAGDTFRVSVIVNTGGKSINAAEGSLSFNANELSVVGISKGSMFNLWTQEPTYSNSAGTISFGGGSPGGYSGSTGAVMTITFRAKNAGDSAVNFSGGSVLAADGRGTNILTSMGNGRYTFSSAEVNPEPEVIEYVAPANTPAAPIITSSSHPNQNGWYQNKTAELSWTLPSGVTGVRTLLDTNSGSIPTKVYEPAINSISLADLDEGVQYFHIQFRNNEGWGRVAHYRLAVDTISPNSFTILLPESADISNPEQTLVLEVTDQTSPVNRYKIQIDGDVPYEYIDETGSSTVLLPSLEPGYHTVIIEAFDAAGNSIVDSFSFDIAAFDRPTFTDYPKQLNEGVIPVIIGQTRPRSIVTVSLNKRGIEPENYDVVANDSGVFTFIPSGSLSQGVYELSAVAVDEFGAKSERSNMVMIAVQPPGYLLIGSFVVSVLSVFVPLLALLVLLGVVVWYVLFRLLRLRKRVARESSEIMTILDSEFTKLERLLGDESAAVAASRKSKKLTKSEEHFVKSLKEALAQAKKKVVKEVDDVEDLVD